MMATVMIMRGRLKKKKVQNPRHNSRLVREVEAQSLKSSRRKSKRFYALAFAFSSRHDVHNTSTSFDPYHSRSEHDMDIL